MNKIVSYIRVSTQKQGQSGLGLDAQKASLDQYIASSQVELVEEFVEVESGRKSDKTRPELKKALAMCRKNKATLVVAKLDRLARNVHFISGLMESKVPFIALDMPYASELNIHVMSAFAEHEAKRIGERTKAALAIAKERGVLLGQKGYLNLKPNLEKRMADAEAFTQSLASVFQGFKLLGLTQRQMVDELNNLGIKTAQGKEWRLIQVQRQLARLQPKPPKKGL